MFIELYQFYFDWLYNGVYPTFMSNQSAEFATILMCIITIVAVIALAILPIRAIINLIWR